MQLVLLLFLSILVLSKADDETPAPTVLQTFTSTGAVYRTSSSEVMLDRCEVGMDGPLCHELITKDSESAGKVCVSILTNNELEVSMQASGEYTLVRNQLWIGEDLADMPFKNGGPDTSKFSRYLCESRGIPEAHWNVPVADRCVQGEPEMKLSVVAHSIVSKKDISGKADMLTMVDAFAIGENAVPDPFYSTFDVTVRCNCPPEEQELVMEETAEVQATEKGSSEELTYASEKPEPSAPMRTSMRVRGNARTPSNEPEEENKGGGSGTRSATPLRSESVDEASRLQRTSARVSGGRGGRAPVPLKEPGQGMSVEEARENNTDSKPSESAEDESEEATPTLQETSTRIRNEHTAAQTSQPEPTDEKPEEEPPALQRTSARVTGGRGGYAPAPVQAPLPEAQVTLEAEAEPVQEKKTTLQRTSARVDGGRVRGPRNLRFRRDS